MIEWCPLRKQQQQQQQQQSNLRPDLQQQQTFLLRSAALNYLPPATAAGLRQQQFGRSGSSIVIPANQQPARAGQLALLAALSPEKSLFNRLDGFVLQLDASRDFFAHWPDRICQRIRSSGSTLKQQLNNQDQQQQQQRNANQEEHQHHQNGSAVCWTGQTYGSYTKKLVEFGKTNMQDHPEVPIGQPTRVNDMILTFIDKFKIINDQLIRHSNRLPLPQNPVQLYATGSSSSIKSRPSIKSGDLRRTVSSPPSFEAQKSSLEMHGATGDKQQMPDMSSLMAMANLVPQSLPEEQNDAEALNEPTGDGSNIDESIVDDSTPTDEDEEEEDNSSQDPCKGDNDCSNLSNSASSSSSSNSANNNNGLSITDEVLDNLQSKPTSQVHEEHQHHAYDVPGMTRYPQRISSRYPNPYPTPTVSWEQSTTYEDFTSVRQASGAATQLVGQLTISLSLLAAAWIAHTSRRISIVHY